MTKRIILTISLICIFLLYNNPASSQANSYTADTPWPMYQHDVQHTGRSPFAGPEHEPVLLWTTAKPLDQTPFYGAGGISISSDGNLVVSNHKLTKFDPINRQTVWQYAEYGGSNYVEPLIGADSSIYWAYNSRIARLNQEGLPVWIDEFTNNLVQNSSPQFTDRGDVLYLHDGIWLFDQEGNLKWLIPFDWYAHGVPAMNGNGKIYASGSSLADKLCSYTLDGLVDWCTPLPGGKIDTDLTPAIGSDGSIYVPSAQYLNKLSPAGNILWSFAPDTGGLGSQFYFTHGLAIAPSGTIYTYLNTPPTGTLYAVSPDGQLLWKKAFAPNPLPLLRDWNATVDHPLLTDRIGNVYICVTNSHCYGINPFGETLWDFKFPLVDSIGITGSLQPIILNDGLILLTDNHGGYYALADPGLAPVLESSVKSIQTYVDPDSPDSFQSVRITSSIPGYPYRVEFPEINWLTTNLSGITDDDLILQFHTADLPEGIYQTSIQIKPDGWIGNDLTISISAAVGIKQSFFPAVMNGANKPERILYWSLYFNDAQIASITPDGLNRTPLITNLSSVQQIDDLVYSPDGKKIVFWRLQNRTHTLLVYDINTGKPIKEYPFNATIPTWSENSSQLAFSSDQDGNFDIYLWDLASDQVARVTNNTAIEKDVLLSPDGVWLAYTTGINQAGIVRRDGSQLQTLPNASGSMNIPVAWSPDGRFLLIRATDRLWKYDTWTKAYALVAAIAVDSGQPVNWSKDGKQIMFVSQFDIYVVNPDGSGLINITQSPQIEKNPSWSPEGKSIVFSRKENDGGAQDDLFRIDYDGSDLIRLTYNILYDGTPYWTN